MRWNRPHYEAAEEFVGKYIPAVVPYQGRETRTLLADRLELLLEETVRTERKRARRVRRAKGF